MLSCVAVCCREINVLILSYLISFKPRLPPALDSQTKVQTLTRPFHYIVLVRCICTVHILPLGCHLRNTSSISIGNTPPKTSPRESLTNNQRQVGDSLLSNMSSLFMYTLGDLLQRRHFVIPSQIINILWTDYTLICGRLLRTAPNWQGRHIMLTSTFLFNAFYGIFLYTTIQIFYSAIFYS
jgi:hypothetical protein